MRILGVVSSSSREVPNAPTIGTATDVGTGRAFNNGAATVTFTAPTWTGGLPITGYTVTSSPGGFTGTGASSPITVTGLQSNTNYTFTVTATNAVGTSAASAASNSILATTVPQAPTIGTATAGNASATVTYTANATGGKAVSTYTATSSPGSLTGTGASPITVSGLTNGTAYTFTVTATNANGTSTASAASNSVTPVSPYWVEYTSAPNPSYGLDYYSTTGLIYMPTPTSATVNGYLNLNTTGAISSQRQQTLTGSNINMNAQAIAKQRVNGSNNGWVYTFGYGNRTSTVLTHAVAAWDENGVYKFCYRNTNTSVGGGILYDAAASDSNGIVWAAGSITVSGTGYPYILQITGNGGINYAQRHNANEGFYGHVGADTSGRGFAVGRVDNGSGATLWNTNGTVAWTRKFTSATGQAQGAACYSSSYNYVTAVFVQSAAPTVSTLIALNDAGTEQWKRDITFTTQRPADTAHGCMDSSGNSYFIYQYQNQTTARREGTIFKYNNSGVLQWQRRFQHSTAQFPLNSLKTDGTNLFITTTTTGPNILRYPCDGSITGSYSYRGGTLTISADNFTDSAGSSTVSTFATTTTVTYGTWSSITGTDAASSFSVTQKVDL